MEILSTFDVVFATRAALDELARQDRIVAASIVECCAGGDSATHPGNKERNFDKVLLTDRRRRCAEGREGGAFPEPC
jgi:hypothetical protein